MHGLQLNKEKTQCAHMAMHTPACNLQWAGEKAKLKAAETRGGSAQVLELGEIKGKAQVATERWDSEDRRGT